MDFAELKETAIAQVVPLTAVDQMANVNEAFVKASINKAYHIVERAAVWKFSEAEAAITATAGTRVCSDLPADFGLSLHIYSSALKDTLYFFDNRQGMYLDQSAVGQVQGYGLWQGNLEFYPLPKADETLTLRYYKKWADLVLDADEPIIPEAWHSLLVDYASGQLALRLPPTGDRFLPNSKAQPYLDAFNIGLAEMKNSDLVLPTWDKVPNHDYFNEVLSIGEW